MLSHLQAEHTKMHARCTLADKSTLGALTMVTHFIQAIKDWWQKNMPATMDVKLSPAELLDRLWASFPSGSGASTHKEWRETLWKQPYDVMAELHSTYVTRYIKLAGVKGLSPVEAQTQLLVNLTPFVHKYAEGKTAGEVCIGADPRRNARADATNFKISEFGSHVDRTMTQILASGQTNIPGEAAPREQLALESSGGSNRQRRRQLPLERYVTNTIGTWADVERDYERDYELAAKFSDTSLPFVSTHGVDTNGLHQLQLEVGEMLVWPVSKSGQRGGRQSRDEARIMELKKRRPAEDQRRRRAEVLLRHS